MGGTLSRGTARTSRRLLTAAAATLLAIGAAGCGPSADQQDDPTTQEKLTEGPSDGGTGSDGGGSTEDDQDTQSDTVSDGGGDAAIGGETAGRPPAFLYVVQGVSDAVDTSAPEWTLGAQDLQGILTGYDAISDRSVPSCQGDLTYTDGASVTCTASFALEGLEGEQELTVMAVRAPAGFDKAGAPALLVSIGAKPSAEALEVFTDQDNHLVGVGQGSMFGSAELSTTELAEAVATTANSDNGFAPLEAPIVVSECEGPLPAGSAEPVGCDAAWEHSPSEEFDVEAMGVWFVDSDPGLLVALEIGDQDSADDGEG